MKDISLYVHIPFCEKKCAYCAFNSFCANDLELEQYLEALCEEIAKRKSERPVKTIYIGGGTPSILSESQIEKVVTTIFDNFNIYEDAEFTIEANPNSITEEKLLCWKKLRINRLSIGVQSLSDKSLKKIGRLHDRKIALEKIKLARKYFDNVSADLIVGLEGESGKDLCRYAKELLELKVKHVSCYLLEVYEDTLLGKMVKNKSYKPLDDDQMIAAFNKLSNYLVDQGMWRYEISNFAFEGYDSRHNFSYWRRDEYLGFGASAHSFEGSRRYKNADTISDYKKGVVVDEILTTEEIVEEEIMLGLRCASGIDLAKIKSLGRDLTQDEYYKDYLDQGILCENDGVVTLNSAYYHVSNTIISNLL